MIQSVFFTMKAIRFARLPFTCPSLLGKKNLTSTQIPWFQYYPTPNGQQDDTDTETS